MRRDSTSTPSGRRARTASSTTKPLPWNSPRTSTRPVASTGSRGLTCETRGTATGSGAPTERSGNSRRRIRIWQTNSIRADPKRHAGHGGGTPRPLNGAQCVASGAGGDRPGEADRGVMRLGLEHAGAERGSPDPAAGRRLSDRSRSQERQRSSDGRAAANQGRRRRSAAVGSSVRSSHAKARSPAGCGRRERVRQRRIPASTPVSFRALRPAAQANPAGRDHLSREQP